MEISQQLWAVFGWWLNHTLQQSGSASVLRSFVGSTIQIHFYKDVQLTELLTALSSQWLILAHGELLHLDSRSPTEQPTVNHASQTAVLSNLPNVEISIAIPALLAALQQETDPLKRSQAVFRSLNITGSADLANTLGKVVQSWHWDVAEDLSRCLSFLPKPLADTLSEQLTGGVRQSADQIQWQAKSLYQQVAHWLAVESQWFVPKHQLDQLSQDLFDLRDAVDRLEQKIKCLKTQSS